MIHETIDSNEIIKLFRQFLDANSATRVLYVVGETKLGKSHLLTKVFPTLAQEEYQAYYAIIDLRYPMHTIPDILALTSNQFEGKSWTHYQGAYQAWTTQPTVQLEKICLLLSSVKISAKQ
ncbi:MAG TPA: hypothetical protein VFQ36_09550, partial [Ktedonobacteraceae bacterium]|nr:hypothetical protein [Ktedonobacteraceae bacterium]